MTRTYKIMEATSKRLVIARHLDIGSWEYEFEFDQIGDRMFKDFIGDCTSRRTSTCTSTK